MTLPGIIAVKSKESAQKALTGDMYARRWTEIRGKGKKQRVVEHELHVNPITTAIGLGAAAVGGALALWALQLKLTPSRANTVRSAYVWPTTDKLASGVYVNADSVPLPAPTRPIHVSGTGHWESTGKGINKGPYGWSAGARMWVVDTPAHDETETANWRVLSTESGKKVFSIEQREGFNATNFVKDLTGMGKPIFGKWFEGQFWRKKT